MIATEVSAPNSAPNSRKATAAASDRSTREKDWKAEIHTPEATYNANVPCDAIEPDPQNRKDFDEDGLKSLAESIKTEGLQQPIVLRDLSGGKFRIIAGERRWRAVYKLLKRPTIAAMIRKSETDLGAAKKQAIENLQREGLNPVDEARQYRRLAELGMTQAEIGKLAGGKSQPVIANTLKLLELPGAVQQMIADGALTSAHGLELVRFAKHKKVCEFIAARAAKEGITTKELRDDGDLPFDGALVKAGLVEEICTYSYYDTHYTCPPALKDDPDFIWDTYTSYYIKPADPKDNKWAPEKAKQDAARAAKKKNADKKEDAKQSTMSPAEKAARAKTIAENKQARAECAKAQERVMDLLSTTKGFAAAPLVIIAQKALSHHWRVDRRVGDAAKAVGIELPKGFSPDHIKWLAKLKPEDLLVLTAAAILLDESEQSLKFAGGIPEEVEHVLGEKKAATIKTDVKAQLAAAAAAKAAKKGGAK
jgi:ParB/RepB/Spo0J family partition protein